MGFVRTVKDKDLRKGVAGVRARAASSDRGAILLEFTIVFPVIILSFVGLVGLAQLMSAIVRVAQDTYLVTYVSAETGSIDGPGAASTRFAKLQGITKGSAVKSAVLSSVSYNNSATASGNLPPYAVRTNIRADVNGIFSLKGTGVTMIAPVLVRSSTSSTSINPVFSNVPASASAAPTSTPIPSGTATPPPTATPYLGSGGTGSCGSSALAPSVITYCKASAGKTLFGGISESESVAVPMLEEF